MGGLSSLGPLRIGPFRVERPIVLAPMAGVSESPYRIMSLEAGAGLAPTELVSAKGLEFGNARTEGYLKHDPAREPLLSVQVYGGDPDAMARAAERAVERGAKIVDVNMGCPVKKVTRNTAGSALMTVPDRAAAIIRAMVQRVGDTVPVTAKIRSGWTDDAKNAPELGVMLQDAGVAALAIHPRTRSQGYTGCADWTMIAALKRAVPDLPVIANGDIWTADDADRVVDSTGCDGVMIGRAALGNPWVFAALAARHAGRDGPPLPTPGQRVEVILHHLGALIEHHEDEVRALRKFRQHLVWYSRGLRDGARFRERVMELEERAAVEDVIASFFGGAESVDASEMPIYDARTAFG